MSTRLERIKAARARRITATRLIKSALLMVLGVFSAAFGLESFLLPAGFIDGGATGMALLISAVTHLPLPVLLICINVPFVLLGFNTIGREFAIKATIAIALLAVVLAAAHFPNVTHDKLLVAVFGGFFLGAGIGLTVRGGGVLDGTEILAITITRKLSVTIGDVVMGINVLVFGAAAYFLSVEAALYSMISYLAASKTLDFVIEGIEEYTGITIISNRSDEVREMIINVMGRGVTVYTGKHGYGKRGRTGDVDIIYTVVTRLEISRLNAELEKIDRNAFVVMNSVRDTKGGMIKKRAHKH